MSTFGRLDGAANVAGIAGGEGQITESIVCGVVRRRLGSHLLIIFTTGPNRLGANDICQSHWRDALYARAVAAHA